MHFLILGILLGLGAAIPIGPISLEIIRRNLRYGTPYGIVTGLGACFADLTYLVLLCIGALTLLEYPTVLRMLGIAGSFILAWFGIQAFRSTITDVSEKTSQPSLKRFSLEGYIMTLVNPFTVLFWASISSQISLAALREFSAVWYAGCGVIIGTVSWVLVLNTLIHHTRHKLDNKAIKWLNHIGGLILLGFAVMGFVHAFL